MSTQTTTDLAARFEAKREEAERNLPSTFVGALGAYWRGRVNAFAEARDMAHADAAGGAIDIANALRDAYDQGFSDSGEGWNAEYPGDVHEKQSFKDVRDAWIQQYMAELPPPAQQGSSSSLSQGETAGAPHYTPGLIHYPDDDRLEFVASDVATVARHLGAGCAVLLNMETREPVGFYIEQVSKLVPASLATARDGGTGAGDPRKEALAVLEDLDPIFTPELWIAELRHRALDTDIIGGLGAAQRALAKADRIEAALATVSATDQAGEVRE
jgi:hypothetical protein